MIKDANGDELTYWPISGLIEGEESETLTFTVPTPGGELYSNLRDEVAVYARRKGVGASYQNISVTPLDISGMPSGETEFEIYIEALSPIVGLVRVPLSVTAGTSGPAGW